MSEVGRISFQFITHNILTRFNELTKKVAQIMLTLWNLNNTTFVPVFIRLRSN